MDIKNESKGEEKVMNSKRKIEYQMGHKSKGTINNNNNNNNNSNNNIKLQNLEHLKLFTAKSSKQK